MTENMKAFMDAIQNNEKLKKKFNEITGKEQAEQKDYTDEYIALAKECGITLTKEDFEFDKEELSDEDLENVSGGLLRELKGWEIARIFPDITSTGAYKKLKEKSETTQDQNE